MSDTEQKLQQKALIPHEHVVIPYELLHPKLQEHAERVNLMRNNELILTTLSMYVSTSLAGLSYGIPLGFHLIRENPHPMLVIGIIGSMIDCFFQGLIFPSIGYRTWKNHYQNENPPKEFLFAQTYLPSTGSRIATHQSIDVINDLIYNNESPFQRLDSTELLTKHNVGMFDRCGNLVLIRHPDSEYNEKKVARPAKLFRRVAWHQPFKRARFEINPPQVKEKNTAPFLDRKLAALLG